MSILLLVSFMQFYLWWKTVFNEIVVTGTIKAMLSGPGQFAENETNEVNFREIPSHVLQKVCMYFSYKVCVPLSHPAEH